MEIQAETKEKAKKTIILFYENEYTKIKKELTKEEKEKIEEKERNNYQTKEKLKITELEKHTLISLGENKKHEENNKDTIRKATGLIAKYTKKECINQYNIKMLNTKETEKEIDAITEGIILGLYEYTEYQTKEEENNKEKKTEKVSVLVNNVKKSNEKIKRTKDICEEINRTRSLVNRPPSDKTPIQIVKEAKKLGKKYGFKVKVLGRKELEKQGLNALLAVSKGSDKEPQLAILELNLSNEENNKKNKKEEKETKKGKKKNKPIAIIGKGVTFDAGGIQVKPGEYMNDMKSDMAGAATVLGTITTLAKLKSKKSVVGIMGLTENMLGPNAYKPDDIIKAYNKKTIEIKHTDAEGRLVLADAISYAEKNYEPKIIIDLATLTGACLIALGYRVAGIIGNNQKLIEKLKESSQKTDELIWQLPLYNHYKEMMKGNISDLRNMPKAPKSYNPGTIVAAAFLENFVEKTPWAHIDIAGTAYSYEKTEYTPLGGTGWGIRLLTDFINNK